LIAEVSFTILLRYLEKVAYFFAAANEKTQVLERKQMERSGQCAFQAFKRRERLHSAQGRLERPDKHTGHTSGATLHGMFIVYQYMLFIILSCTLIMNGLY